jgi:hypothetical protein
MIVDASALVALVRDEPGADRFFRALSDTREPKRGGELPRSRNRHCGSLG